MFTETSFMDLLGLLCFGTVHYAANCGGSSSTSGGTKSKPYGELDASGGVTAGALHRSFGHRADWGRRVVSCEAEAKGARWSVAEAVL